MLTHLVNDTNIFGPQNIHFMLSVNMCMLKKLTQVLRNLKKYFIKIHTSVLFTLISSSYLDFYFNLYRMKISYLEEKMVVHNVFCANIISPCFHFNSK